MSDFLDKQGRLSRERVIAARARRPEAGLLAEAEASAGPLPLHLDRFDLIAELKLRSPAVGGLATADFDRKAQLRAYAAGGAAAVSVLTEPTQFEGSLAHLREAAEILNPLGVPVMRKDFLIDPYQLIEARANGASGALLIAAMLDDHVLGEMLDCAARLGLFILLEAFDAADLARINDCVTVSQDPTGAAVLAGVNCRNLRTLAVDFDRFLKLAEHLPGHLPTVAESGIASITDIRKVAGAGYQLALVGSSLMQSGSTAQTAKAFIDAGRESI